MEINFKTVLPTGTCFDDVVDFLLDHIKEDKSSIHRIQIVHAILLDEFNEPYSHAWAEMDGVVYHTGILNGEKVTLGLCKAEYYAETRVQECTYYSVLEAKQMEKKHKHPGPWEKKYIDLCRGGMDEQ